MTPSVPLCHRVTPQVGVDHLSNPLLRRASYPHRCPLHLDGKFPGIVVFTQSSTGPNARGLDPHWCTGAGKRNIGSGARPPDTGQIRWQDARGRDHPEHPAIAPRDQPQVDRTCMHGTQQPDGTHAQGSSASARVTSLSGEDQHRAKTEDRGHPAGVHPSCPIGNWWA